MLLLKCFFKFIFDGQMMGKKGSIIYKKVLWFYFTTQNYIFLCCRGKFGTVYRCHEKSTGLTLAAKFVGIARREDRRNVEREVMIMRMLQHPRVIQLYDAFEASNVMCVVQEM